MRCVIRLRNFAEHDAKTDVHGLSEAGLFALLCGDFQCTREKVFNDWLTRAERA
jgi:hypothetical protein